MDNFETIPGFCPTCGSILPQIKMIGHIVCYNCKEEFSPDVLGNMQVEYTIHFNSHDSSKKKNIKIKGEDDNADGPVIDRRCPKCGHGKMSYATVQLRSADEGQTVFFTCIKCKFKESENS